MQSLSGFIYLFIEHFLSFRHVPSTVPQREDRSGGVYHALAFTELASKGSQARGQPYIWLLLILLPSSYTLRPSFVTLPKIHSPQRV